MKFFSRKQNKGTPMPIKKRKKDIRGSITALVVLILVPTIVFEGFLVDLARMKLYGDQAIMVADNYGESVLTVYNNVLKDLYGLFAISSQNKDGSAELNGMEDFIASAFNPASNVIIFDHGTEYQNMTGTGQQARYYGFMPYKDAKVTLSYEPIKSSALSEQDVFSTQIFPVEVLILSASSIAAEKRTSPVLKEICASSKWKASGILIAAVLPSTQRDV